MKSIKEKAKAYDEAIERAKRMFSDKELYYLFPELREDEKIRRELMDFIDVTCVPVKDLKKKEKFLTWLEKLGEQKETNLVEILKHYPRETELYSPLYGRLWLAEVDEKNAIITCYKHHLEEGCTRAVLEQEDTVSFYSNGTTGLPDYTTSKDCMLFLYDIEQQGTKKPADKVEPKFKVGDKIRRKAPRLYDKDMQVARIERDYYICNHIGKFSSEPISFSEESNYELVEQEPADKIEPMFRIGDWVVNNDSGVIQHIKEIVNVNDETLYVFDEDSVLDINFQEQYHLWTIQDVKDGDVLATGDKNFETPFIAIYKSLGDTVYKGLGDDLTFNSHCFIGFDGNFYEGEEGHTIENTHPATKEQRDLLFTKMKEAGFEWDAKKKELKKIENKNPLLSDFFKAEYERGKSDALKCVEWSEEDKRLFDSVVWHLRHSVNNGDWEHSAGQLENWLESLKQRYTWKPSEEQIEVLEDTIKAYNEVSFPTEVRVLSSLCNELKKF